MRRGLWFLSVVSGLWVVGARCFLVIGRRPNFWAFNSQEPDPIRSHRGDQLREILLIVAIQSQPISLRRLGRAREHHSRRPRQTARPVKGALAKEARRQHANPHVIASLAQLDYRRLIRPLLRLLRCQYVAFQPWIAMAQMLTEPAKYAVRASPPPQIEINQADAYAGELQLDRTIGLLLVCLRRARTDKLSHIPPQATSEWRLAIAARARKRGVDRASRRERVKQW